MKVREDRMAITGLSIAAVEPFADGHQFGEAGPYVRIQRKPADSSM
jgi:hypothetical protein